MKGGEWVMECKGCKREIPDNSNFCCYCSKKQDEVCNCWIMKEPYSCGLDKCPGYGLYKILLNAKKLDERNSDKLSLNKLF